MIYPDWPAPANVFACTTTRRGGASQAPYDAFNLAGHVGDAAASVQANRLELCRHLALPTEPVWLEQVHGCRVVDAAAAGSTARADASVSFQANVVCVVLTADCLPALICSRRGDRVAAVHAGWRGLAAGVLEATVDALKIDPQELLVWLGPAIGPQAFQVGAEVREVFLDVHPEAAEAFAPQAGGYWLADLYALARIRLGSVGVKAVHGGNMCTFSQDSLFYSYRREAVTGRMASLIWFT